MPGIIQTVTGGQFGSEGKGAILGHIAREIGDGVAVRVGGSQAGHTVYGNILDETHPIAWALRHVPVAAVTNPEAVLVIAAGSEIDPQVLTSEVDRLEKAGYSVHDRLFIDPAATLIAPEHLEREAMNGIEKRSGSTGKGVGMARVDRVMRTARTVGDIPATVVNCGTIRETAPLMRTALRNGRTVQIEGTQGYGLGVHTRWYPHTTSGDCRAIDVLAQAGLSPWAPYVDRIEPIVVFRPYPIRIAGNSGPLAGETTWEELGLYPELTTVTRKTRRVGQWDPALAAEAIEANGGNARVAIAMLDHVAPEIAGATRVEQLTDAAMQFVARVQRDTNTRVWYAGTGPNSVVELV